MIREWVRELCRAAIAPEPDLTLSEWADQYRVLPSTTAEAGPWRTDRVPFLREIMDHMTPSHPCERVVVMKSAQVGATEALLNLIGYVIHQIYGNILLVQPSTELVQRNTPARIDPLLEQTPVLRERVVAAASRRSGNSMSRKRFRGGDLIMTGANSAAGLRSVAARFVLKDEVDAYPPDVGDEGDPSSLADRASITFRGRRKIVEVSTPTIEGLSRIELSYKRGDQRRYVTPCSRCEEGFVMSWDHVTWPEGQREKAHLVCPHCGGVIEDHERLGMVARGRWQATAEGDGKTVSFHLTGLLSPWTSLGDLAVEHGQVHKNPLLHQTFRNLKLGELWKLEVGAAPEVATCMARRESWGDRLPAGVVWSLRPVWTCKATAWSTRWLAGDGMRRTGRWSTR